MGGAALMVRTTSDTAVRGGGMNVRLVRGALWVAGALAVSFAALRPDRIVVERVVFDGVDRAALGELRHMADVENGTTLWSVDVDAVAENVERHPWVKAASVERRWPDALVVHVQERVPRLMAAWGGTLYYVDDAGVPFLVAEPNDLDHPVLIGLSRELDEVNPRLSWLVLHDTLWLLDALASRKLVPTTDVAQITFERTRGFTFTLKGGTRERRTSEILIVPGDYDRQLEHLQRVLQEGVRMGAPVRIDVAPPRVALVRRLDGPDLEPEPVVRPSVAAPPPSGGAPSAPLPTTPTAQPAAGLTPAQPAPAEGAAPPAAEAPPKPESGAKPGAPVKPTPAPKPVQEVAPPAASSAEPGAAARAEGETEAP